MSTITLEQQTTIAEKLATMHLPSGLGTEEAACSIAAINLALSGKLTDDIPDCMSEVIGKWIIRVQDAMPADMRNSVKWKQLLPLAAGTGRDKEKERLAIIIDWMWGTVLPTIQPLADERGFGAEWKRMTTERTQEAAKAAAYADAAAKAADAAAKATYAAAMAAKAAADAAADAAYAAAYAADAAYAAAYAAYAAYAAADAAAADAAYAAADAAAADAAATYAAAYAAKAAADASALAWSAADAALAAKAAAWQTFDPCGLLARLIDVK
ncbi:MAG: hypothetical protein ING23_12505 [Roseomonas sp.]|nr:hypothetical protein [Roseomonas sp.]